MAASRRVRCTLLTLLVTLASAGSAAATTPTVWTVTRTDDPAPGTTCVPGNCSLRQAIAMENPIAGDSVQLPASVTPYTLSAALGRIVVAKSLVLTGAGARSTVVSGGNATAIFGIAGPGSPIVTISGLTLTGGFDNVTAPGTPAGGGAIAPLLPLATTVTLNLTDDAVVGNKASSASSNATGGGISTTAGWTATLRRVLVAANEASAGAFGAFGGGIANGGTLTLIDSTVTGNTAIAAGAAGLGVGGGISNAATLTLKGVTLAANAAVNSAVAASSEGGDLMSNTSGANHLTFANTIVSGGAAGQSTNTNCDLLGSNAPLTLGGNVDSLNQCGLGAGELRTTDPKLGVLGDHGGPTDTLALLAGSPAFRAGTAANCTTSDQRGFARPATCSIGAYEPQPPAVTAAASAAAVAAGAPAGFTATPADPDLGEALSAVWHFDDGARAQGLAVSHAFATAGRHGATVTITDSLGLTASATATVNVLAPPVRITKYRLAPATFRAAGKGATLAARKHARPPVGTRVSFTLSASAAATFRLRGGTSGRRSGSRCVKVTRKNRGGKACTRYVSVAGSAGLAGKAGAQSVRFTGRWHGKALAPGRYRLRLTAVGAGGRAAASRGFKIVR